MKRTLNDYLALLERDALILSLPADLDRDMAVTHVSYDSRDVVPGTLFICKGAHFKPEFLAMARDKGAVAYVSLTPYPEVDLPCILVGDMRRTIAVGDYNNDVGMLKAAGLGIAVANAVKEAKEAADLITVSNEEHAIAQIISDIENGRITI